MTYDPQPIDTDGIELDDDACALLETLAEHTHDVWARRRLADGWQAGPSLDDAAKRHPALVPYAELPEDHKELNRSAVEGVLKALLALKYTIKPPGTGPGPLPDRGTAGDNALDAIRRMARGSRPDVAQLNRLWSFRNPCLWSLNPEVYRSLAERLLELAQPFLAFDVAAEGLFYSASDVRLRQLQALALARTGATRRARRLLQELETEGADDAETLGMLARTSKDLWRKAEDREAGQSYLAQAIQQYAAAYERTDSFWVGINAATLSAVAGNRAAATRLATRVQDQCERILPSLSQESRDRYWCLATLGEAALVLGRWETSREWYGAAAAAARGHYGDLASTVGNLRLLAEKFDEVGEQVASRITLPEVLLFAGTVGDPADGQPRSLAPEAEERLTASLHSSLAADKPVVGFACVTGAAEIVFLERVLEVSGEVHVVLPFNEVALADICFGAPSEEQWVERLKLLLQAAREAGEVVTVSPEPLAGGTLIFDHARRVTLGLAEMRADQFGKNVRGLTLHDGGGERQGSEAGSSSAVAADAEPPREGAEIAAMLFADVKGFSKLNDRQIRPFVEQFYGTVARLVEDPELRPLANNTWGDGLFCVFDGPTRAGSFALRLRDTLEQLDWEAHGLPGDLATRIGLHVGPVYRSLDPVTRRINFFGANVSRAARIEPITPPRQVYASQEFAALIRLLDRPPFACDFVGSTAMAKGYGSFPTYHVRWVSE